MCDLADFLAAHPKSKKIGTFNESDLSDLEKKKIPSDLIEFLRNEGISTYHNDFFCTTLPQEHFKTLSEWGLKGEDCYTFLKTAFGSLCFLNKSKVFQLDPFYGYLFKGRFDFCKFMNLLAPMDSFMEGCYFDVYQKIKKKQTLAPEEIYALTPALPLGGSFETSHFEVVKMREHLGFLAQLFDNKTTNP